MPAVGCLVVLVVLLLELACRCYRRLLIRRPGLQKRVSGQKLRLRWRLCHAVDDDDGGGASQQLQGWWRFLAGCRKL